MSDRGESTATETEAAPPEQEERHEWQTHEKKYMDIQNSEGGVFIKRSVTRDEWWNNIYGTLIVPPMPLERIKNEAAAIEYIRTHTNIPVPIVRCSFEDRGCHYIVTDIVPGVQMAKLTESQKIVVLKEVEEHLATMRSIKSTTMGGFLGKACLPYRLAAMRIPLDELQTMRFKESVPYELVLCHNDLSQHNIMVDESTLKITAILDWEYAGFYPKEFEGTFYKRPGPSGALEGEVNDEELLLAMLEECKRKPGE
ncbi:hypothetical protein FA95DRAFT_129883 [Auriscalpium vulgare]|uniref:Uncharacterized protein n=1 Tax=Auriscalpium vulgare TaxID=40419 RepID=A0ACB8RMS2_9AGAM|nr:hypothetical protein FA95DRAFT_129883 [Auriscalpium vulgare]